MDQRKIYTTLKELVSSCDEKSSAKDLKKMHLALKAFISEMDSETKTNPSKIPDPHGINWLKDVINSTTDIIYALDNNGFFTYMSPRFEEFTGIPVKNIIGRPFSVICKGDDLLKAQKEFQRGIKAGYNSLYEVTIETKDGKKIPAEVNVNTLYDKKGDPVGRIGVARNITRRKKELQQIFTTITSTLLELRDDYSTNVQLILDSSLKVFRNTFSGYHSLFNPVPFISKSFLPDSSTTAPVSLLKEICGNILKKISGKSPALHIIRRVQILEQYPCLAGIGINTLICLPVSFNNRVSGIFFLACDISIELPEIDKELMYVIAGSLSLEEERRLARQQLKDNEIKFRNILETITDGYIETDLTGSIIYCNPAACKILGIKSEILPCLKISEIFNSSDPSFFNKITNPFINEGLDEHSINWDYAQPGGTEKTLEASITPSKNTKDTFTGLQIVIRDVTHWKNEKERWRKLFSSLPGGSFVVDENYIIQYVNPITCALSGYSEEELVGRKCDIICPKGPHLCPIFDKKKELIDNDETAIKQKNGEKRPVLKNARVLSIDGTNYIVENFLDITRLKDAAEELRASRELLKERNEAIEKDLRTAQSIQQTFMGGDLSNNIGLKIDYRFRSLDVIGGDFFSFSPLSGNELSLFLGDIASHGITAALFLSLIKATTERIIIKSSRNPVEYLKSLNSELYSQMPYSFLTAIYGIFSRNTDGSYYFTFANAGHTQPVYCPASGKKCRLLSPKGTLMGVFKDIKCERASLALKPGDRLFLYTDGIPETTNPGGEILGFDWLPEILMELHGEPLDRVLDLVIEKAREFRGGKPIQDDVILIGIEA